MSRRLLPESAYDFWTRDGRDGEEGERRDTLAEARADAARLRKVEREKGRPWSQCCIEVTWELNERKLLKLLAAAPRHGEGKVGG